MVGEVIPLPMLIAWRGTLKKKKKSALDNIGLVEQETISCYIL